MCPAIFDSEHVARLGAAKFSADCLRSLRRRCRRHHAPRFSEQKRLIGPVARSDCDESLNLETAAICYAAFAGSRTILPVLFSNSDSTHVTASLSVTRYALSAIGFASFRSGCVASTCLVRPATLSFRLPVL